MEYFGWLLREGLDDNADSAWEALIEACTNLEAAALFDDLCRRKEELIDPFLLSEMEKVASEPRGVRLARYGKEMVPFEDIAARRAIFTSTKTPRMTIRTTPSPWRTMAWHPRRSTIPTLLTCRRNPISHHPKSAATIRAPAAAGRNTKSVAGRDAIRKDKPGAGTSHWRRGRRRHLGRRGVAPTGSAPIVAIRTFSGHACILEWAGAPGTARNAHAILHFFSTTGGLTHC